MIQISLPVFRAEARKSQTSPSWGRWNKLPSTSAKINKEQSEDMPKANREAWNHEHDGLRSHSKLVNHELTPVVEKDSNADVRGIQFAHATLEERINQIFPTQMEKVEAQAQPEISFGTFPDWHEHAYKRADDSIKEIISLLLKKSELQIRIGETEDSLRNDQEALAEVTRGITRVELPS